MITDRPFAWAVWRADGFLHGYVRTDRIAEGITGGWEAVFGCPQEEDDPANRQRWHIDPVSEPDYETLRNNTDSFQHLGMRQEFLAETKAQDARTAAGMPPICGYAAWAPDGTLIALANAVRGLNSLHSLGIGDHIDDITVHGLSDEEQVHLNTYPHRYNEPGGLDTFLNWRDGEPTAPSPLHKALTEALISHGPRHNSGIPENIRAQFLIDCLTAFDRAAEETQ